MDFTGKVAVVTGGANGIGKSIVQAFQKAGSKTAVIDITETPCDCELYFQGDIAEEDTLRQFVDSVSDRFGKVDYLINNACVSRKGLLSDCGYEDFLYVQKVGVAAPYMLTRLLLPYFGEAAAVVNISSTRAYMSQPDTESYTAAKGGIAALTHALAVSLAGRVRVNAISPGWIDTSQSSFSAADRLQHPSGRVGAPEDIARVALLLCHGDSSFINGENITVDGGMTRLMVYHNDCGWQYREK